MALEEEIRQRVEELERRLSEVTYNDLPSPKLDVLYIRKIFNVHFDKNNVRVETADFIKNRVYFYFGNELFARAELTSNGEVKKITLGADVTTDDLVKLAISLAPDIPYKPHLMRRFDITQDDPEVHRHQQNYFREKHRIEKILSDYNSFDKLPGWKTTDPRSHDPANFRYLVHAIVPEDIKKDREALCSEIAKNGVTIDDKLDFDPLCEPEKFIARKYISCSVIDQAHYGTWNNAGFVLKVPLENIIEADSKDMGTLPSDVFNYGGHDIPTAEEILRETDFGSYNEVLIHGTNPKTKSQIKIIGGFVVVDPITEKDRNPEMAYRIKAFCDTRALPLVKINYPLK